MVGRLSFLGHHIFRCYVSFREGIKIFFPLPASYDKEYQKKTVGFISVGFRVSGLGFLNTDPHQVSGGFWMSRATNWDDPLSSWLACFQADLHLSRFSRCIWNHLSCACWILAFKDFQGMKNWRNNVLMSFLHIKSPKPTDLRIFLHHCSISNRQNQQISVFFHAICHIKPSNTNRSLNNDSI